MTTDLLEEAVSRYGVRSSQLRELDGFESFIFEAPVDGRRAIIRIGHSGRRPYRFVVGELNWIDYLASRDIGVARPVPSRNGQLVETVGDGHSGEFVLAAFSFAEGHPPTLHDWAPPLWRRYGRLLGRIHEATLQYRPDRRGDRPSWDEEVAGLRAFLPATESGAQQALDDVLGHLENLPRGPDSYGLTHGDPHAGNFHVTDDGRITLFDFDDCNYFWLVNDVALVAFYALSWVRDEDPAEYLSAFWLHFWPAYREAHDLDARWLAEIPWFMKLRELDTYAVIHRSMDIEAIDDRWARWFMSGRKERIDSGAPVVDLDFTVL